MVMSGPLSFTSKQARSELVTAAPPFFAFHETPCPLVFCQQQEQKPSFLYHVITALSQHCGPKY